MVALVAPVIAGLAATPVLAQPVASVAQAFRAPRDEHKPWVYWWWLNGCVSRAGIVRDLDYMKEKGIAGALVFHAGEGLTPWRTEFMSAGWRELFTFAVNEAATRNIVISLNLCAGWNAGGPWIKPEDAAQSLTWRAAIVSGGRPVMLNLPKAERGPGERAPVRLKEMAGSPVPPREPVEHAYHRDVAVLAWQLVDGATGKTLAADSMVDLSARLDGDRLSWDAPAGDWVVLRFGHHVSHRAYTKCSGGDIHLEADPLRSEVMDLHFAATAGVVIDDVRPHVGRTFQAVHIDSSELGRPDWTARLPDEFARRRGYRLEPFLAARAGYIVGDAARTARFQEDFDRTVAELMTGNYYGRLTELAGRHGLKTHSQAAGFQKPPVDGVAALGASSVPNAEFWARRSETDGLFFINQLREPHLVNHDAIKTAASAARNYGSPLVMAEAFTVGRWGDDVVYPNWDRGPFELKDLGDRAFCAGANRFVLSEFIHQPDDAHPGYRWPGVGMEFDRTVTWSRASEGWLGYLARCQSILQEGRFLADVAYFQGEWAPDFVPPRWAMSPALPAGFDCDVVNADTLARRAGVGADGRLRLAGGMSYRYLVFSERGRWRSVPGLPGQTPSRLPSSDATNETRLALSLATLRSIQRLLTEGVTVVGLAPSRAIGLGGSPAADAEFARRAGEIWGAAPAASGERRLGAGRLIWGRPLAAVFARDGLAPDVEIAEEAATARLPAATLSGIPNPGTFDWIHRAFDDGDAYFVANLRNAEAAGEFTFRATGHTLELWDPVTGEIRALSQHSATADNRTRVKLRFAARQSFFLIFRRDAAAAPVARPTPPRPDFPGTSAVMTLAGPWRVAFDPRWGGPAATRFDSLVDWTSRPEPGVKFYSGAATYRIRFDLPAGLPPEAERRMFIDLGTVKNVARVRLNGRELGNVWTAPWRVATTAALRAAGNELEIEVTNLWPNRLIGDAALPPTERLTVTNVGGFTPATPLLPSGLLGPVTLRLENPSH